jgi:hypothetical protein
LKKPAENRQARQLHLRFDLIHSLKSIYDMKKLLWIFASALLLSNVFLSTGCQEDDPIVNDLPPLVKVTDGTSEITSLVMTGSQVFTVYVEGTKGTKQLTTLTIKENGTTIDASRVEVVGTGGGSGTLLVSGADKDGFDWQIKITSHTSFGEKEYTFTLADEGGLTDEASVDVTVQEPLSKSLTGILLNQGGPAGQGALDLDDGKRTGVTTTGEVPPSEGEIRDMGIDSSAMSLEVNWRQKIAGVNGCEIRKVGVGAPEGFDFTKVDSKDQILAAFSTADAFTETLNGIKVNTGKVQKNDVFVVKRPDNRHYLVKVDNVVVTPADNQDKYELSIKY